jgi:hypothetical protein
VVNLFKELNLHPRLDGDDHSFFQVTALRICRCMAGRGIVDGMVKVLWV